MKFKNNFEILPSFLNGIYKKELIIKNKFIFSNSSIYQNLQFSYKNFSKTNIISYSNNSFNTKISNKHFLVIEKYFNKLSNNDIFFNTKKISIFLENLNIIENKKEFKFLYQEINEIIKKDNYLHNEFKNSELRFLNYLFNYDEEIAFDIFLNIKKYNKTHPKISVIIPIYNSENFIKECLNSLINQSFKNFEIIGINDGSTDNSLKILKEFEEKDERIYLKTQNNLGAGIARNVGMKMAKGEYLIFLDSDDIFNETMLEELYAKIKGNNLEIVICNSNSFDTLNNKKIFYGKRYSFSDEQMMILNKNFSSLNIKKDFFDLFVWWPWDKIFKKKFIENLGIEFQNLKSTNDLFFICSAVISSNKITFLDKVFINHRVNIKTSIENSREKSWDNFYYALKELKNFIKIKGLYKRFKQDFINYVASFSIWHLETMNGKSFCFLYKKIRNEWWNEFGVSKRPQNYFYHRNIYIKLKIILESDLREIDIKINDTKIDYLNEKKKNCIPKVSVIIPVYNAEKYLSNSLNSIINQTLKNIEIICINDGSFDNSLKILNYFKEIDNRIIIINQKNKGVNFARNEGLKIAKGQFVLFFDSDDILIKDALEKLFELSVKNKLEILYFNSKIIFDDKIIENDYPNNIHYKVNSNNNFKNGNEIFLKFINENKWIFSPCSQFIKNSVLLNNKISFLEGIKFDDNLFSFNLISYINNGLEINEIYYLKMLHYKTFKKTDKLLKILYDYIINLKELLLISLKFEYNENLINYVSLELFIDSLEEKIFFVFKKIQLDSIFIINQWKINEQILLLLILINEKNIVDFVKDLLKKNKNFHLIFLFNKFEKKNCFKLNYKIKEYKKFLL